MGYGSSCIGVLVVEHELAVAIPVDGRALSLDCASAYGNGTLALDDYACWRNLVEQSVHVVGALAGCKQQLLSLCHLLSVCNIRLVGVDVDHANL